MIIIPDEEVVTKPKRGQAERKAATDDQYRDLQGKLDEIAERDETLKTKGQAIDKLFADRDWPPDHRFPEGSGHLIQRETLIRRLKTPLAVRRRQRRSKTPRKS